MPGGADDRASELRAVPRLARPIEWGAETWGFDLGEVHLTRTDGSAAARRQAWSTTADASRRTRSSSSTASVSRARLARSPRPAPIADVEPSLDGRQQPAAPAARLDLERLGEQTIVTRSWPRSLTTELVTRLADRRIESVAESRAFHLFWREHLPRPGAPGRGVRRVRAVSWAAWTSRGRSTGSSVEIDGRLEVPHDATRGRDVSTQFLLREKRREELICALTGWVCIRITWEDLSPAATCWPAGSGGSSSHGLCGRPDARPVGGIPASSRDVATHSNVRDTRSTGYHAHSPYDTGRFSYGVESTIVVRVETLAAERIRASRSSRALGRGHPDLEDVGLVAGDRPARLDLRDRRAGARGSRRAGTGRSGVIETNAVSGRPDLLVVDRGAVPA